MTRRPIKKGTPYEGVKRSTVRCESCDVDIPVRSATEHFSRHRLAETRRRLRQTGYAQRRLI